MTDADQPGDGHRYDIVLLIDIAHTHEGLMGALYATGRQSRVAAVAERRWDEHLDLFDNYNVVAAIGDVTPPAVINLGADQRRDFLSNSALSH